MEKLNKLRLLALHYGRKISSWSMWIVLGQNKLPSEADNPIVRSLFITSWLKQEKNWSPFKK